MQQYTGRFRMWPTYTDDPRPKLSTYVMHVLAEASRNGHPIASDVIDRGRRFLREGILEGKAFRKKHSDAYRLSTQAYALAVLALLNDADHGTQTYLFNQRDKLPLLAKSHLALALHLSQGDANQLDALLTDLNNAIAISSTGAYVGSPSLDELGVIWHSDVRATSFALYTLAQARPDHPLLPKLVSWLQAKRQNGRWITTQENAIASMAMLAYLRAFERDTPDMVARLFVGEDLLLSQTFKGRSQDVHSTFVPMAQLGAGQRDIVLDRAGKGRLYYTLRMSYAPRERILPPREEGFTLTRRYESLETGEALTSFKPGQVVKVRLTIVAPQDRRFVALRDPLPAGLEPINLKFATTSAKLSHQLRMSEKDRRSNTWYSRYAFDHIEQRDDTVQAFADDLNAGVYEYVYLARATAFGSFSTPPALIEEMYSPEVFGRTTGTVMDVKE